MKFFETEFNRFLAAGAFNTVAGYAMYLAFNVAMDFRLAYTASYLIGIVLSYWINSKFVFRAPFSWKRLVVFPSVYLLQYGVGLALIWLFVNHLDISEMIAPLLAAPVTIPLTFLTSRLVIKGKKHA